MTQLGGEELWAKACIERALPEVTVCQHDDGSKPSMYDLTIVYPDGSRGAVEVTTAADRKYVELAKALDEKARQWQVPGLTGTWWVRVLPSARANDLRQQLPGILRGLESDDIADIRGNRSSHDALVAKLGKLSIVAANHAMTPRDGRVLVTAEQKPELMGGGSPATGDPLATWLGEWLSDPSRPDNVQKVTRSDANERHVFVLVSGFTTNFAVTDILATANAPLPTIPPDLPDGITHVWVMSMWIDWGEGFCWSADDGWRRFEKVRPPVSDSK
jgi:hypothetical protein